MLVDLRQYRHGIAAPERVGDGAERSEDGNSSDIARFRCGDLVLVVHRGSHNYVILLDIWMPDTDGMSLLKEWASQGPLPCPVIMMSGHANIDMAVEATKFGAYSFLEKPTSIKTLTEALRAALAAKQTMERTAAAVQCSADNAEKNKKEQSTSRSLNELIDFSLPLREARDQFERAYFSHLLEQENYSMTRVAAKAQLERTHLYRKLRQLHGRFYFDVADREIFVSRFSGVV